MATKLVTVYVCDWCKAETVGPPPKGWEGWKELGRCTECGSKDEDSELLCPACASARDEAIRKARKVRVRQ